MNRLNETLHYNYKTEIESTYIITIKNHAQSEEMAQRCLESCSKVNQKAQIWEAFDGTDGTVKIPLHAIGKDYLKYLKLVNFTLTPPEVCCLLSHVSLWSRCIEIDQPIAILEHDAIMVAKYTHHMAFNAIVYLGSIEQAQSNYWNLIPIYAQLSPDYRYILRTHAYSIDPMMARNLLSHVIKYGIHTAVDVMIRADIFSIVQHGIFAIDLSGKTTIPENDEPNK